ncbi:hypothetical protein GGQ68_002520 [Sagittula marina]|uniref:Tip attachment protein J HDII-ins2 domain-containing protein n=1 Tax=Sagittula marina TaxID=943940 RepID=A0A7W6DNV1_9RHOB|nr:hypothetical protein [Sagittula marina]MBB3986182.1 hypothetical protein [Sagittula marina]
MIHGIAINAALPDVGRKTVDLLGEQTVADVVAALIPGAAEHVLDAARVTIHHDGKEALVPRSAWARTRPHDGTRVVVALPPEVNAVLGIAGVVANYITGSLYYAGFTGLGVAGTNAIFVGTVVGLGALAVAGLNALVPTLPEMKNGRSQEDAYSISGWRNQARPGEPIPLPLGRIRAAPVFIAPPYTEVVGDDQYLRALFCFGYGPLKISDIRIGDVPIDDMTGVQYEVREGRPDDAPISLVREIVQEQGVSLELEGPQPPTDAAGNPIAGPLEDRPYIMTTAENSTRVRVILQFPGGLHRISTSDGDVRPRGVEVLYSIRQAGTEVWQEVEEVGYAGQTTQAFFRSYTFDLPSRGRWDVRIDRVGVKSTDPVHSETVNLWSVQSIKPEYPINFGKPLALLSVRIRASFQLNGTLDNLTALTERYVRDWNGSDWVEATSANPASVYAYALTANHNRRPASDSEIDWDFLQDWHEYCAANGLEYSHNHIDRTPLREMLVHIAAAGRASPRHDGGKWGGIIDWKRSFVSRHISPRNSRDFQAERSYFRHPHGYRARFRDEAESYEEREIVVPWPGVAAGDVEEAIQRTIKGVTSADKMQRALYRSMIEAERRRDRWSVVMFDVSEHVERGDNVALSHYELSDRMTTGRVLHVSGNQVVLDERVTMVEGESYGISWQHYDADDTTGTKRTAEVVTVPGETSALGVVGQTLPPVGALVSFGPGEMITEDAVVLYVEAGSEGARVVHMTNAVPELDALTAAYEPAEFSGIVGEVVGSDAVPLVPVFTGVSTEVPEGEYGPTAREVRVSARAASADTALIANILVEHRLTGETEWDQTTINGASGTASILYDDEDEIDLRATALRADGVSGDPTAVVEYVVGSDLGDLPAQPDLATLSAEGGLGRAVIELRHSDPNTTALEVFRTAVGNTLDTDADSLGIYDLAPGMTIAVIDGDTSRVDLLDSLDFSGAAGSTVSNAVAITDGRTYRGAVTITGSTAGNVTLALTGTGDDVETAALSGNALHLVSLVAGPDLTDVSLTRSADFDGTVTVVLIEESAASAPQGEQEYRFAAHDGGDLSSAITAPLTTTII